MQSKASFLFRSAMPLVMIAMSLSMACSADEEPVTPYQATFYSTYGFEEGDNWVIPMRVWVHGRHILADAAVKKVSASMGTLFPGEADHFRSRIEYFVVDSESGKEVTLKFDKDPEDQEYRVQGAGGRFPETDLNGLIEGKIEISRARAKELLRRQGSENGWLTYRATSKGHTGTGRVRLVGPTGLSVISDIDDTIKVTEILAGPKTVVRNTFFRKFAGAPEMATMYKQWEGASFHYVSGGPWQLYGPLSEFLFSEEGGFPEGSFHMKNVRKNLWSLNTWEDLEQLVANENHTFDLKVEHISEIMKNFPDRKFILIGDSGEKDPDVYREIKTLFPRQVQEIRIRDVKNDKEKNPSRLEGMTILQAVAVSER
ncbi:MAG TPA: App1 family protein [Thermoanaerobaculia bacterium]|nr:App1 family protein [Thermoanaerobaculia bacterium]